MAKVKTLKIESKNEQGFVIINESDFVDGKDKLFSESKTKKK